jgi:hypothetical protein
MTTKEEYIALDPGYPEPDCKWLVLEMVEMTDQEQSDGRYLLPRILKASTYKGNKVKRDSPEASLILHTDQIKKLRDFCDRCLAS